MGGRWILSDIIFTVEQCKELCCGSSTVMSVTHDYLQHSLPVVSPLFIYLFIYIFILYYLIYDALIYHRASIQGADQDLRKESC